MARRSFRPGSVQRARRCLGVTRKRGLFAPVQPFCSRLWNASSWGPGKTNPVYHGTAERERPAMSASRTLSFLALTALYISTGPDVIVCGHACAASWTFAHSLTTITLCRDSLATQAFAATMRSGRSSSTSTAMRPPAKFRHWRRIRASGADAPANFPRARPQWSARPMRSSVACEGAWGRERVPAGLPETGGT